MKTGGSIETIPTNQQSVSE